MRVITLKATNRTESITKHYAIVGETDEYFEQHRRHIVISDGYRNTLNKNNHYIVADYVMPSIDAYTQYAKALALYVRLSDMIKEASPYVEYGLNNIITHTGYTDTIVTDADIVSAGANLPALKRARQRVASIMAHYRAEVVEWLRNEYSHEG